MSFWIPLAIVAVAALLVAERVESRSGIAVAKLIAAACFIGFALACGALETPYGRVLLCGLVLCALGDALLLPPGQTIWFQLGIGSFLLGHLAYAIAFYQLGLDGKVFIIAGAALTAFALATLRWLRPHVPAELGVAVVAYIVVICGMVTTAVAASAAGAPSAIALGAVLFAASDLSVARDRFIQASWMNAGWGLPAYFAAQMILAATAGGST
ncbi:MAG: lysoplasmalogenase family protein [Myxococcota bacterium]